MIMNEIIIYGSCYGTTKQYAEELAKRTGYELVSYDDVVDDINTYKTIIYLGGLYAGGVMGMKKTLKKLTDISDKKIIIATVGLADPTDKENIESIRNKMKSQLSKDIFENATILHLRGGIDYSKLNFKHKMMMGMVYKKAVNLPEEKKNAEVRAMIETYDKQAYFVDFDSLDIIINSI